MSASNVMTDATVEQVTSAFLDWKIRKAKQKDITDGMRGEYAAMMKIILECFGTGRIASSLRPSDFVDLREYASRKRGAHWLKKFVGVVRSVFNHAYNSDLLELPPRFGPEFKSPSKAEFRRIQESRGERFLDADDCHRLLDKANTQLRALMMLALNGGFGQTELATLLSESVDLESGWIRTVCSRTEIVRRCPLWPETIAAIREHRLDKPKPIDRNDDGLEFITAHGLRWVRYIDRGPDCRGTSLDILTNAFKKLAIRAKVQIPCGFNVLRLTHRTVADNAMDVPASCVVMGRLAPGTREFIPDDRLKDVTDFVRDWLFEGSK